MTEDECRQMLSRFSHEVRNPVTLINSFLQLLVREHPEIATYSFYEKIIENMNLLTGLLDEMSRFNNAARLQKEPTDLSAFLRDIADSGAVMLASYGTSVSCRCPEKLPEISLDQSKFLQALYNLIRNAAEAMPDGGHILIRASRSSAETRIEVENDGPAIPKEYLPDLFQPFITHKKNGTGLGLAICQEIITAHGGTITVSSSEGSTIFTIILPDACKPHADRRQNTF